MGNLLFKQCVGIPVGIDPPPLWANLHLYVYECEYITTLMKTDKVRARRFRYATRFIDDEYNLNDNEEFGRSFHLIYSFHVRHFISSHLFCFYIYFLLFIVGFTICSSNIRQKVQSKIIITIKKKKKRNLTANSFLLYKLKMNKCTCT